MTDAGFLQSHGHELKWLRSDLPIAVLLHPSALDYLFEAEVITNAFNSAIGRSAFMRPTDTVLPELLACFEDEKKRASITATVLLRGDGPIDIKHCGQTDMRQDERSGRILNAVVTLPPKDEAIQALGLGDRTHGQQLLYQAGLHEFGHVLGLNHDDVPESIMWYQVRTDASMLLSGDVARLRAAYG